MLLNNLFGYIDYFITSCLHLAKKTYPVLLPQTLHHSPSPHCRQSRPFKCLTRSVTKENLQHFLVRSHGSSFTLYSENSSRHMTPLSLTASRHNHYGVLEIPQHGRFLRKDWLSDPTPLVITAVHSS